MAVATISCTDAESATSVRAKHAAPPASVINRTVSAPPSASMSATTTLAPSRAKPIAEARPIPEAAPVTTLTLPSKRPLSGMDPPVTWLADC